MPKSLEMPGTRPPGERRERLRFLMFVHGLSAKAAGKLMLVTPHAVRCMRTSKDSPPSEKALRLLEFELGEREPSAASRPPG